MTRECNFFGWPKRSLFLGLALTGAFLGTSCSKTSSSSPQPHNPQVKEDTSETSPQTGEATGSTWNDEQKQLMLTSCEGDKELADLTAESRGQVCSCRGDIIVDNVGPEELDTLPEKNIDFSSCDSLSVKAPQGGVAGEQKEEIKDKGQGETIVVEDNAELEARKAYDNLIADPNYQDIAYPTSFSQEADAEIVRIYKTSFTGIRVVATPAEKKDESDILIDVTQCEVADADGVYCDAQVEKELGGMPLAKRVYIALGVDTDGNPAAIQPYCEVLKMETLVRADMFDTLSHIGFYIDYQINGISRNKLKLADIVTLNDGSKGYVHEFAVVQRCSSSRDEVEQWESEFKPHAVLQEAGGTFARYWDTALGNYRLQEMTPTLDDFTSIDYSDLEAYPF